MSPRKVIFILLNVKLFKEIENVIINLMRIKPTIMETGGDTNNQSYTSKILFMTLKQIYKL